MRTTMNNNRMLVASCIAALAMVCLACGHAAEVGSHDDKPTPESLAVADGLASRVSTQAHALLESVVGSGVGPRYGMLNPNDPQTGSADFMEIKRLESPLREAIADKVLSNPRIDLVFVAYGQYVLFAEKRFESRSDREAWLKNSGGDMYSGPFDDLVFGQPCDFSSNSEIPEIMITPKGTLVGVPICESGRFVCALYLRLAE